MKSQNLWTIFAGGVIVISEVALMDALYVSFSWIEHRDFRSLGLHLWILCSLLCYAANLLFLRRPRSIPALAVFNAALWALSLCALFLFTARLSGWASVVLAVLFVLTSLARALHFSQNSARLSTHLIHVDMLALTLLWLALAAQDVLLTHPSYLSLQLIVFLLCLLCAVALRVGGDGSGRVLVGAPVAGGLLSAGMLGGLIMIVFLLIRLFADHSRTAVEHLIHGLTAGLSALWQGLLAVLTWFFSLFPDKGAEDADLLLPPVDSFPDGEVVIDEFKLDPRLLWALGGLAAAAVLALLLVALFHLRHSKLSLRKIGGIAPAPIRRRKLQSGLKKRLSALWHTLCFHVTAFRRRNTPAGVLVWLERRMKKAGMPRLSGETHRAFLLRISPELKPLAQTLDMQFFSTGKASISRIECRRLRRLPLPINPDPAPCPDDSCGCTE